MQEKNALRRSFFSGARWLGARNGIIVVEHSAPRNCGAKLPSRKLIFPIGSRGFNRSLRDVYRSLRGTA